MLCAELYKIINAYLATDNKSLLFEFKSKYHSSHLSIYNFVDKHEYFDVTMAAVPTRPNEYVYIQWRTIENKYDDYEIYDKSRIYHLGQYESEQFPVAYLKYSYL